ETGPDDGDRGVGGEALLRRTGGRRVRFEPGDGGAPVAEPGGEVARTAPDVEHVAGPGRGHPAGGPAPVVVVVAPRMPSVEAVESGERHAATVAPSGGGPVTAVPLGAGAAAPGRGATAQQPKRRLSTSPRFEALIEPCPRGRVAAPPLPPRPEAVERCPSAAGTGIGGRRPSSLRSPRPGLLRGRAVPALSGRRRRRRGRGRAAAPTPRPAPGSVRPSSARR